MRKFVKIGGFSSYNNIDFVSPGFIYYKDGRIKVNDYYDLEKCLQLVKEGAWKEITEPKDFLKIS